MKRLFFRFNLFRIELDLKSLVFIERVTIDCSDNFKRCENLCFLLNREFVIFLVLSFDWSLVRVCLSEFIISLVGIFSRVTSCRESLEAGQY